jgi:hypothetical protein
MDSRVIRPVERSVIDLSGLAADGAATICLARRIDVSTFTSAVVYLRLHPGSLIAQTPAAANFIVNADGYTSEDPAALDSLEYPAFQEPISTTDIKLLAPGAMKVIPLADYGSMLSLYLYVAASASGTLRYILSCDVVCKRS